MKTIKNPNKPVHGTREWAVKNINFIDGCAHDCRYCYAKSIAVRFKRKTTDNWTIEEVNPQKVLAKFKKLEGQIMFPSSHDLTPDHVDTAIIVLEKLLKAGNQILIVSKPHLDVIQKICERFQLHREQILFRFTIGSKDDDILRFWEPNAPGFTERLEALKFAHKQGYKTSISIEPALDTETFDLVHKLEPYVTDTIWIGLANRLKGNLKLNGYADKETLARADELMRIQNDDWVRNLADKLADNPKIRWKDSIKKILKIERPLTAGLDE